MKFLKVTLRKIVYNDFAFAELIEDKIVDTSRWSVLHVMIFKYKDKFYTSSYSVGATEQQDEQPYQYAADSIECPEVRAHEVMTIEWVLVE